MEVDTDQGVIKNLTSSKEYKFIPVPPFMQQIIAAGGLINYLKFRKSYDNWRFATIQKPD